MDGTFWIYAFLCLGCLIAFFIGRLFKHMEKKREFDFVSWCTVEDDLGIHRCVDPCNVLASAADTLELEAEFRLMNEERPYIYFITRAFNQNLLQAYFYEKLSLPKLKKNILFPNESYFILAMYRFLSKYDDRWALGKVNDMLSEKRTEDDRIFENSGKLTELGIVLFKMLLITGLCFEKDEGINPKQERFYSKYVKDTLRESLASKY